MQVFAPIFNNLNDIIKQCDLSNNEFREPLIVLRELCEIKINNTRPLCEIVSSFYSN